MSAVYRHNRVKTYNTSDACLTPIEVYKLVSDRLMTY
jgi:hypothetical protein